MGKCVVLAGRVKKSLSFVSVVFFVVICMCSAPVFAEHYSSAELQPEWSASGQVMEYTVTFYNNATSPDDIGEVRIYKNLNYENFVCYEKTGWILSEPAPGVCNYYGYPKGVTKIPNGSSESFNFSAITSVDPLDTCQLVWQFETRDLTYPNQGSINYLSDTTSIDSKAPNITKTVGMPKFGPCPPGDGQECWVTKDTQITVQVTDDYPDTQCDSGIDYCTYKIYLDDNPTPIFEHTFDPAEPEMNIGWVVNFTEDSKHTLEIFCVDMAGNNVTDVEVFRVDDTPPETEKTYGAPHFPPNINDPAPYPHWINTSTLITLTAQDGGPICSISNMTTYYRDFVVDNPYCEDEIACEMGRFDPQIPPFMPYEGPFNKTEESCHVLEYFSVDGLGNDESIKRQCVYVEDQPPTGTKVVGVPKLPCDPVGEPPYCDGTPEPNSCSDYDLRQCEDIPGCEWHVLEDDICIGIPEPDACRNYDELQCGFIDGCAWDPPGGCFGTPIMPCEVIQQIGESNGYPNKCDETPGCQWDTYTIDEWCEGEPNSCSVIDDPFKCDEETPGCEWVEPPTHECFWVQDHVTEINLTCVDEGLHPVDHEEVCFRVSFDIEPWLTTKYCSLVGGIMQGPGDYEWCCVDHQARIVFEEDSVHDLEYYCVDALGNENEIDKEYFKVDSVAPNITKTMFGSWLGECPPRPGTGDICYVADNNESGVIIDVSDPDPTGMGCNVSDITCYYEIWWEDEPSAPVETGEFTDYAEIIFKEDSTHELYIYCEDALGNWVDEWETFLVDSNPPETTKTYGEPYKAEPDCVSYYENYCFDHWNTDGYESWEDCVTSNVHANCPQWINSSTPIYLTSYDEKIGQVVPDTTYWRNLAVTDETEGNLICGGMKDVTGMPYCNPQYYIGNPNVTVETGWTEYTGPFHKPVQSCHIIEYYSIDALGNEEIHKWQCVFVDNTPPDGIKDVGEPSIFIGGNETCDIIYNGDVPEGSGATIIPPELRAVLNPGDSITEHKYITTEDVPIGKLDVLFLFDLTGSMRDEIDEAKTSAVDIMDNISSTVADSAFGVGSFMDYTDHYSSCGYSATYGSSLAGDYPWNLDQDITTSTSAINTSIDSLSLGSGEDVPESYARALYESQFVSWRDGSRRVVIIFEDNVPHDCNLDSYEDLDDNCALSSTGIDPGNDTIAGTSDDLNWSGVISQLKAAGISVVVVNSGGETDCDGVWKYAANETGGIYSMLDDATELPQEIVRLVENITSTISELTLAPKPGFEEWVEWSPDAYHDVGGGETVEFDINITVPHDQPGGEYHFYIRVVGDGSTIAVQEIWVNVTGPPAVCDSEIDWWVGANTNITLSCIDPEPHPVDQETVCFRISYDYPIWNYDKTEEYCDHYNGTMNNGYCCIYVGDEPFTFNFLEDTMHNLEFYCIDHLGNKNEDDIEYFKVDTVPPNTTKTHHGAYYINSTTGAEYIDTASWITLDADDGDNVCATGVNETYWQNVLYECELDWYYCESPANCDTWDPETELDPNGWNVYEGPIYKQNESCHVFAYYSEDNLGNKEDIQWQCFFVDKKPPVTNKWYAGPFFEENGTEWITNETEVWLSAYDPEPHPSGVNKTYYRDVYLENEEDWHYCYSNCTGWNEDIRFGLPTAPEPYNPSSSAGWTSWDGVPFHKEDESCHIIEYYSFDNVKKLEELNWQCVFVDNTVPVPNKTVGKPSTYCDNSSGNCTWEWKITTMTPITLSCDDMGPHPSDHSMVHWRIWWDGSDNWTEWHNATEGTEIYFGEECLHQLEFYCTDAVGHESELDLEWIKVEGTSFEIQLNKKWNLISVPFVMLDNSIDEVFADIADKVESVWTYDRAADEWYVYTPGPALDTLSEMEPGWGYWVKTTDDVNLSIGGSLFSPATTPASKKIVKGWNLVGYWGTEGLPGYYGPAGNGLPAYCEFYSLGEDILDKEFASLWSYWEPYNPNMWIKFGDWNPQMDPGAGYWLYTNQEGEFVVPTTCGF